MKNLLKDAVLASVYHIAKETVSTIELQMKKEEQVGKEPPDEKEIRRKLMLIGTLHTLLGIIYND